MAFHFFTSSQTALYPASILDIERELVRDQKVCLDRPYYRWKIGLGAPLKGEITFGATGFTQTLRTEPVLMASQCLFFGERNRLINR